MRSNASSKAIPDRKICKASLPIIPYRSIYLHQISLMIQRIQTIWLLLAALAIFLTIRIPFYSGTDSVSLEFRELTGTTSLIILILSSAIGTCSVISIFFFKNRKVQMRLVLVCIIAECLVLYLYIRQVALFDKGNLAIGSFLHPIIIIFLILAAMGIYKDSKLIKESNRLR